MRAKRIIKTTGAGMRREMKGEGTMWPITDLLRGPGFLRSEGVGWQDLPS